MRLLHVLRQRLRSLFRSADADVELARELAFHLEQLTQENIGRGMEPATARLAAQRAIGGFAHIGEQCRDHRRIGWLTDLRDDLAYAWRTLAKSPGFSVLAVATLALGVGASIAVYALAEALLLRSLPYPEPERLVRVAAAYQQYEGGFTGQENFRDWEAQNSVFESMALTASVQMTVTADGEAERVGGRTVSVGFFELLGVEPQLGRRFTAEEQKPGAPCSVMASHGFWVRQFGQRQDAVGSTIAMNEEPCRIVGVMPESFRFNESGRGIAAYWMPIRTVTHSRLEHQYAVYARLRQGVPVEAAQAQMSEIASRLEQAYPENKGWGVRVRSMRTELLRQHTPQLIAFGSAALIVLLVACANVACLLLARGMGRSREMAMRVALGAGRGRVVRLLLTESLLLSGLSAALGIAVAVWLLRLAAAAAPETMQLGSALSVSVWLVLFAAGLTLSTSLLAGLWPALRGSRTKLESDLKEGSGALIASRRQIRSLQVLVVTEVALSVVLLTFAGLLTKSFTRLLATDLGYRADDLLTFQIPLPASRYRTPVARLQFWDALLPKVAAVPGVLSAAAADSLPLGEMYVQAPVTIAGQAPPRDMADAMTHGAIVTPDYFRTMGIPLRAGRAFTERDTAAAEPVAIVNEAFVRKMLAGRTAVGTRLRIGNAPWVRIVGVIGDVRHFGPMQPEPRPEAYIPYTMAPFVQFVAVRTAVPTDVVLGEIRGIVRQLDAGLPLAEVKTMRKSVDRTLLLRRQMMTVVVGFGLVTLAMATIGLAGTMLYAVSRRRREFGLRIALGARPADISRGVLRSAARLVAAGSAIGVLVALASGRIIQSQLFGVDWYDPATLAAAPALLAAIALAACLLPSRRAATVSPMQALREE